jgi:glycosyltransferase involved in cell wall biosynthesis
MWEEPAGLTMIEAMACGIPTITTCSGGIPEYVDDCAIVLERDERLVMNIAAQVDLLLADKDLYDKYDLDIFEREYIDSMIKSME